MKRFKLLYLSEALVLSPQALEVAHEVGAEETPSIVPQILGRRYRLTVLPLALLLLPEQAWATTWMKDEFSTSTFKAPDDPI